MARPEGDTWWSPLVSFFPPSSPLSMFNLLICIILKIINCCTILGNYSLLFVTKLQRISHCKFEFFLPPSNFLVPPFYPQKKIKVGPIIRIILVPPLSSVNLIRDVVREGREGGLEHPQSETHPPWAPKWNDTFYRGLWRAVSLSPGQPPPSLAPPHFEKACYAPANETAQNTIEFEHGHKRQLSSRSTIFMIYFTSPVKH